MYTNKIRRVKGMIHSSGKRRRYKRYLSMFIAFVMVCSVFIPAFAKSTGNGTDGDEAAKTPASVTYEFYSDGELYDSQTVKDGETLKEPSEPDKDGSTFEGWYTSKDGGSKFTDFSRQSMTESETVKLYARWQEVEESEPETKSVESDSDKDASGNDAENGEEVSDGQEVSEDKDTTSDETDASDDKNSENVSASEEDDKKDVSDTDKENVSADQSEKVDSETDETGVSEPSESSDGKKEDVAADDTEKSEEESDKEKNDTENVTDQAEDSVESETTTEATATTSDDDTQSTGTTESNSVNTIPSRNNIVSSLITLPGTNSISPRATVANVSTTVRVGESIILNGAKATYHRWDSDNRWVASVSGETYEGSVRGVQEGTVTITHQYRDSRWQSWLSETFTVIVKPALEDGTYNLYAYTLIPGVQEDLTKDPNTVWNGMGVGTITDIVPPSTYSQRTVVDDGYGSKGSVINYPEDQYPDITVDGETYKYATNEVEENTKGYYTVSWMRVVADGGANAGNNQYNPTVSTDIRTYHLDGVIILNETDKYTVNFALKDAGETQFIVDENFAARVDAGFQAKNLQRPDKDTVTGSNVYPYRPTKEVNGITYELQCWYKDEACTQEVNWDTETITANTTYYAQYVPVGKDVTITKDVTGGLGDVMKDFSFTYSYSGGNGEFTLKDGGTYTIKNVPVGTTLTLTETNAGGYATSANYGDQNISAIENKESETKTIQITVNSTYDEVTITNNKEAPVDVGIRMDNLPYILMLALVAGGAAAALILRRRRG